jgi:hypothetical protein
MNTYGGENAQFYIFLTSALDDGKWPASFHNCLTQREIFVRVSLDAMKTRKVYVPDKNQTLNLSVHPACSLITIMTVYLGP